MAGKREVAPGLVLKQLEETPSGIAALTLGLSPEQLRTRPGKDEWSASEVLAHLRACADARGECIPAMLAADHPTFRAVNPLTWIKSTDYLELEFRPSLEAFAKQRARLVTILRGLPAESWAHAATVTGAGRPLERTVLFYADWVARHERPHLKQIAKIRGALSSAPGPWA